MVFRNVDWGDLNVVRPAPSSAARAALLALPPKATYTREGNALT